MVGLTKRLLLSILQLRTSLRNIAQNGNFFYATPLYSLWEKGKRDREIEYTKRALPYSKDYSFAAYNFSQLLLRDGQVDLARRYAVEAYKLSYRSEAEADRDLVTATRLQWPSIDTDE